MSDNQCPYYRPISLTRSDYVQPKRECLFHEHFENGNVYAGSADCSPGKWSVNACQQEAARQKAEGERGGVVCYQRKGEDDLVPDEREWPVGRRAKIQPEKWQRTACNYMRVCSSNIRSSYGRRAGDK